MPSSVVYLVLTDCPLMVMGAYWRPDPAHTHARTITGACVVAVLVQDSLPESVLEMLVDEFEGIDTLPVTDPGHE